MADRKSHGQNVQLMMIKLAQYGLNEIWATKWRANSKRPKRTLGKEAIWMNRIYIMMLILIILTLAAYEQGVISWSEAVGVLLAFKVFLVTINLFLDRNLKRGIKS
jgi:hypothetical protein